MKKSLSRLLSLALVLVMVVGMVPMALADTIDFDSVSLNKSALNLEVGGSETLTVSASANGQNLSDLVNVVWTSSDSAVASVSNGAVTAVAAGSATITAACTYEGQAGTYAGEVTATVTVTEPELDTSAVSVSISGVTGGSVLLIDGKATANLTAAVTGSVEGYTATNYAWTGATGTTETAKFEQTVAGSYKVAVTVTFTSTAEGAEPFTKSAEMDIMVKDTSYTVTVSPDTLTMKLKDSATLTATVVNDITESKVQGATVTWSTDAPAAVLTVNPTTGKVTVVAEDMPEDNTYTVTATYTVSDSEVYTGQCAVTIVAGEVYIDQDNVSKYGTGSVILEPVLRFVSDDSLVPGDVSFSFSVVEGKATISASNGACMVKSNTYGVNQILITATWYGGTCKDYIYVSFYSDHDVVVNANTSKFHLEQDNVLTGVKIDGESKSALNNKSIYDILIKLCNEGSHVRLWTSNSTSASGKLSSSSFIEYDDEGTLLYTGKLKPITFEQIAGKTGAAVINFQIGNGSTESDRYVKTATGTITVNFGEASGDIVYTTSKNGSVTLDEDDFYRFYFKSDAKDTLDYVEFGVDSNIPEEGLLYNGSSASTRKLVTTKMDFYYNYSIATNKGTNDYDLDDVTYVANKYAKEDYVDLIPFTCYGTKGDIVTGILEIRTSEMNFVDVKESDYFYDAVVWAVDEGITTGTSATTFSPNNACTRGQVVTFLWRAAGEPSAKISVNPFKDVKKTDYYYDAVLWAVGEGITTGTSSTTFSPNQACTRAQVVTFLYRAFDEPSVSGTNSFTDVKSTDYFAKAVNWAVKKGITTGLSTTSFGPSNACTRGQIVTFLYRAYED